MKLVECVPNFSEGRDKATISAIVNAMERVGATILDVDPGAATNRTVVTMAGPPEIVEMAAFEGIRTAAELIDMTRHHGEHPRIGATDVCPFVPLSGVTMEECVAIAHRVAERVGRELGIPVYMYEEAAKADYRRSLADIRKGEYEGLAEKLKDPRWAPDYGPSKMNEKSGATVIGAREFLIAWNINLNTRDKTLASRIGIRLREQGGIARGADGERLLDPDGEPIKLPGLMKHVRAVGWFIEEYGIAQVSINLVNYKKTPLHVVYEEAKRLASQLGVAVTGSEIVGLVPKEALLTAGRYYLERQGMSPAAPEPELVHMAVRSLGLSDIKPFVPAEKVIEYKLLSGQKTLANDTLSVFLDRVSSDTPVPGGGSVAALCGALGAALSAMVGNLSVRRPELRESYAELKAIATEAQMLKSELLALVTEDSKAFEAVMAASRLPKGTEEQKAVRASALEAANMKAASVPLKVLEACRRVVDLASRVSKLGYEASISDAGVAAACALAGAEGACLNVLINVRSNAGMETLRDRAVQLSNEVRERAKSVLDEVTSRIISPG